jgi:hypothetical protein
MEAAGRRGGRVNGITCAFNASPGHVSMGRRNSHKVLGWSIGSSHLEDDEQCVVALPPTPSASKSRLGN